MKDDKKSDFQVLIEQAQRDKSEAQNDVAARKRVKEQRERERLKKQQEDERKQRELDAKMRQRHLEARQKEEEQKRRREQQEKAAEEARLRREQEARHNMIHGPPKKSKSGPSFPSGSATKRRLSDDDEDQAPGGNFLTREEKRLEKQNRLFRQSTGSKRGAAQSKGYGKAGRSLPGGAVNVPAAGSGSGSPGTMSVKERLKHEPNGLIKLNQHKRDTRTIDEIVNDLHARKTLSGDQAKSFNDWFGDNKKKGTSAPAPAPAPAAPLQRDVAARR